MAPTLTIGGDANANTGEAYTLSLSATDPGPDTITGWEIDWGDGNVQAVAGNPASVQHTYLAAGAVVISATATDEDGTFSSNNLNVAVGAGNLAVTSSTHDSSSVSVRSLRWWMAKLETISETASPAP